MKRLEGEPFATECSNMDARFTSPCCYTDLEGSQIGYRECPKCGRKIECTIEHVPQYTASLIDEGEEDDDAE